MEKVDFYNRLMDMLHRLNANTLQEAINLCDEILDYTVEGNRLSIDEERQWEALLADIDRQKILLNKD